MTISAATAQSRSIRETILRILFNTYSANPSVGLLADHLYIGFSSSQFQYAKNEINVELGDLMEDGLVVVEDAQGTVGPLPLKCYKTTSRGRDFFKANCPWERIDEFTGGQK